MDNTDLLPSRKQLLSMHWEFIFESLRDAAVLREVAYGRAVNGEEVTREDFEKIFSVSDRSAAFIKKVGRKTPFGYRPQLGRSANNFITSIIVLEGNAADSDMLVPNVQEHMSNTPIIPKAVSSDDGMPLQLVARAGSISVWRLQPNQYSNSQRQNHR